jgi:hypothetical protein
MLVWSYHWWFKYPFALVLLQEWKYNNPWYILRYYHNYCFEKWSTYSKGSSHLFSHHTRRQVDILVTKDDLCSHLPCTFDEWVHILFFICWVFVHFSRKNNFQDGIKKWRTLPPHLSNHQATSVAWVNENIMGSPRWNHFNNVGIT